MRKISDPDFVYQPWSEERRERASQAALRRIGTPPGHHLIYGVPVRIAIWKEVRDATSRFHYHKDGTREPLWKTRAFVVLLVELLSQ